MKTGRKIFSSLILIAAFSFFGSLRAHGALAKTLNVGVILRLNDKYNGTVAAIDKGFEVAKVLYEKKNPKVKIKLTRYTIGEDLPSMVAAGDKAAADKVPAVLGGELSEESLVLGERFGPQKIVFMTPTSSAPAVTEGRPFVFRACFSDNIVAEKLAQFTVQKLKPKSVGIIHNISSPYTDFLSKKFIETYNAEMSKVDSAGRAPIYEEKILRDTQDFTAQIDRFIEKKVTHVVMPTHDTDFLRFGQQAAHKGFFPAYIGSDGWGPSKKVFENFVTASPEGKRFVGFQNSYWKEDTKSAIALEFKSAYRKQYKEEPSAWNAVSFDAAWVLFTAMDNAKNPNDGESIRRELSQLKSTKLVTTDHFVFGPDNSPRKDLYIYRIDKDGVKYEVTLK